MTRAEHLEWCRQRALAELDDNADGKAPVRALATLSRDLGKHPDTRSSLTGDWDAHGGPGDLATVDGMRRFLAGLR